MKKIKDKISEYKNNLYSRKYKNNSKDDLERIQELKQRYKSNVNSSWKGVDERLEKNRKIYKESDESGTNAFVIFLIIAFSFFVISVSIAGFFLYFQKNDVPLNQLELSLTSHNTTDSGKEFEYILDFQNNTDYKFKNIEIFAKYPSGTLNAEYKDIISSESWEIAEIKPHSFDRSRRQIILSGSPDDEKEINLTINYQIDGYSSILTKRKKFKVEILTAPIFVKIKTPKTVMSGEEFDIDLEISSNSNATLKDLVLIARYPSGFKVVKQDPDPVFSTDMKNIYKIPELKIGEKKEIHMKAKMIGEDSEPKVISFLAGDSNNYDNEIRTRYFETKEKIIIKKPGLDLKLFCGDVEVGKKLVINPSEKLRCHYNLKNNLDTKVSNIVLKIYYDRDDILDEAAMRTNYGYIDTNNNFILWDKNIDSKQMTAFSSGDIISQDFELDFKTTSEMAGIVKEPNIKLNFEIKAVNFTNNEAVGSVKDSIVKNIQLNTDVRLQSETRYVYDEEKNPIENRGGPTPMVGVEATYTIVWKLYNSTNQIKDIKVTGKLPQGVTWKDNFLPKNSYVSYDRNTREVKWSIKKVEPYIGYRTDPKILMFQIGYIPTLTEVDNHKILIEKKHIEAVDVFTGESLNIEFKNDSTKMVEADRNNYGVVRGLEN